MLNIPVLNIPVLMVSMLAGASALVSLSAAPADCAAQQISVSLAPGGPKSGMPIPQAGPKEREPAVLLPDCKPEPRKKRKKRLSDYPMA